MSDGTIARFFDDGDRPRRTRQERREQAARHARIRSEVRLAEDISTGVFDVYEHAMDGMTELDIHRRRLAGDDPALNMLLAQMQLDARKTVRRVIGGLFQ